MDEWLTTYLTKPSVQIHLTCYLYALAESEPGFSSVLPLLLMGALSSARNS